MKEAKTGMRGDYAVLTTVKFPFQGTPWNKSEDTYDT
jgi:hypothetical protein